MSSSSSSSSSASSPRESLPLTYVHPIHCYRRLGSNGMRVLTVGTLAMLGSFAFLVFLWRGSTANPIWKLIVIIGWASQVATPPVETIKLVLASQVTIAASMLASIAPESFQLALPQAPSGKHPALHEYIWGRTTLRRGCSPVSGRTCCRLLLSSFHLSPPRSCRNS